MKGEGGWDNCRSGRRFSISVSVVQISTNNVRFQVYEAYSPLRRDLHLLERDSKI